MSKGSRSYSRFATANNRDGAVTVAWIDASLIGQVPLRVSIPIVVFWQDDYVVVTRGEDGVWRDQYDDDPFASDDPPTHFLPLPVPPYEAILKIVEEIRQAKGATNV